MKHNLQQPTSLCKEQATKYFDDEGLGRFFRHVGKNEVFSSFANLLGNKAVFVVNENREIIFWSRGAEKLFGFPAEQVLGHHCLKTNRCYNCMLGCGLEEYGELNDVPLVLYRSDGQALTLRKTAKAFFDSEQQFMGGIEILETDLDEEKEPIPEMTPDLVNFHGLQSRSPSMHRVFEIVRKVASTDITILVRGESGTGKELIAKAIHAESLRCDGPFLSINCAALTPTLLESELFGHTKGSFTGAVRDHPGLFKLADGGTLFLDEVAELPLELQAKLLRVLQDQTFYPVGSTEQISVDVRIVAATHRSLRQMVQQGKFREDLMYRLRVVPLYLTALRERREDIEPLLWHFINLRNERSHRELHRVSPETMRILLNHEWPGNVRELQNVLDYAFAVGRGVEFLPDELPPEFSEPMAAACGTPSCAPQVGWGGAQNLPAPQIPAVQDEKQRIQNALEQANGRVGLAAELLGMSRPTFWRKRKKYDL